MSTPPPTRAANIRPAGIGASYALNPTPQGRAAGYVPVQPLGHTEVVTQAPTLGQFWRSDIRRTTVGRRPRWAGLAAFALGLLAVAALLGSSLLALGFLVAVALAVSSAALFFAVIALIAGVGRWLGFFGLLFALAGNIVVIDALVRFFSSST